MIFSDNSKHVIIMYHYVQEPREDRHGLFPIVPQGFERQLKFLSEHYKLTSIEEVYAGAKKGSDKRLCALTFDDGTRDHYENVVPLLSRYDAQGTFFIVTQTLDGILPVAQKNHILLSRATGQELVDAFHAFVEQFLPKEKNTHRIGVEDYIDERRKHEDIRVANFKETVRKLPQDVQEKFLTWIFKEYGFNESDLCREFFMGENEIQDMHRKGFVIGNHTHTHLAFDTQRTEDVRASIGKAQERLTAILGEEPITFSYPYGILGERISATLEVLKDNSIRYGVGMERRDVVSGDDPLILPRYKVNDLTNFLAEQQR